MTTTVKIITHGWPVEVLEYPLGVNREPVPDAEYGTIGAVPKNSSAEFHVHSGRDILVREREPGWEPTPA
jgi:hypothetical protein